MDGANTILGSVVAALLAAVGALWRELRDRPTKREIDDRDKRIAALEAELSGFRQKAHEAVDEARHLADERDAENRKLRDELADLRVAVERRLAGGDPTLARPTTRRPHRAHRAGDDRRGADETR